MYTFLLIPYYPLSPYAGENQTPRPKAERLGDSWMTTTSSASMSMLSSSLRSMPSDHLPFSGRAKYCGLPSVLGGRLGASVRLTVCPSCSLSEVPSRWTSVSIIPIMTYYPSAVRSGESAILIPCDLPIGPSMLPQNLSRFGEGRQSVMRRPCLARASQSSFRSINDIESC